MHLPKVLHLSKFYYPYTGGIEEVCRLLIEGMPQYEQRVLCFNDTNQTVVERIGQVEITRSSAIFQCSSQHISFSLFFQLRKTLKEFRPDIVHVHLPNPLVYPYLLALLPTQTRLVLHWHSDIVEQRLLYTLVRPFEQALLRRADRVVATSERYLLGSQPLSAFRKKCVVIPCPVDTTRLTLTSQTETLAAEIRAQQDNRPLIFFMGRHVTYKGIELLIQAARYVKTDARFLIAGSGPLTPRLKALAADCENIVFLGRIDEQEVTAYFRAASVFAFPSITKNEAFGVVLGEAMYCSLPPVTFTIDHSGVNWVSLADVTGLEIENSNVRAYAAAIDRLLTDEPLRSRFAQAAHNRVEQLFAQKVICKKMDDLYAELLSPSEQQSSPRKPQ